MAAATSSVQFLEVYRIPEAARYLAASSAMGLGSGLGRRRLTTWIRSEMAVAHHSSHNAGPRHISFVDLISMRVVALLRSRGMAFASIRAAERWLQDHLEVERPFASHPLWTGAGDVFTVLGYSLISPSQSGQGAFEFIKTWLAKVELDMSFDSSELASSWTPYEDVCLSPAVQMGQPCIAETRIPTRVILAKVRAGETLEAIGSLYELDVSKVRSAIDWEERVGAT